MKKKNEIIEIDSDLISDLRHRGEFGRAHSLIETFRKDVEEQKRQIIVEDKLKRKRILKFKRDRKKTETFK